MDPACTLLTISKKFKSPIGTEYLTRKGPDDGPKSLIERGTIKMVLPTTRNGDTFQLLVGGARSASWRYLEYVPKAVATVCRFLCPSLASYGCRGQLYFSPGKLLIKEKRHNIENQSLLRGLDTGLCSSGKPLVSRLSGRCWKFQL